MDATACSTCLYRQQPDGDDWCYMFRAPPEGGCAQHTRYKKIVFGRYLTSEPMTFVSADIDMARAELLVHTFRMAHPDLHASLEKLAAQYIALGSETHRLRAALESIKPHLNTKIPPEDKKTRHSTKTGATWPKPKGQKY